MQVLLDIQNTIDSKKLPPPIKIENWVSVALEKVDTKFNQPEVTVRVVSLAESQELNLQYRNKNKPTNILSFPFEVPDMIPQDEIGEFLGDLVICEDIIIQEAKEQKKSLESHWAHMIIHGTLHLIGFDHVMANDAEDMEALEVKILTTLGFSDPY